ncbi:MAG: hypothetical protein QN229_06815 [Desulfurococcaceae archaeon TW002]
MRPIVSLSAANAAESGLVPASSTYNSSLAPPKELTSPNSLFYYFNYEPSSKQLLDQKPRNALLRAL